MKTIRAGQFLYASCSGDSYEILSVGKDINDRDVLDLKVENINDFIWTDRDGFDPEYCQLEVVPAGPVVFKNLAYVLKQCKLDDDIMVVCNTPGNGCHRCTCLFWLRDKK